MKKRNNGKYRTSLTMDGKVKYFYGNTEKQVKKKKEQYIDKIESGEIKHGVNYSFTKWADEWLEFHRGKVKTSTFKMYAHITNELKQVFTISNISKITAYTVQKMLNDLYGQNYSKSTIAKRKITLSMIFDYAIKENIMLVNPCQFTYIPKGASVTKRTDVSDDDIKTILANKSVEFSLYPIILLMFGLRKSEALALTWDDIDIDAKTICVCKMIEFTNNKPVVCNYLKNGQDKRIIPILPIVLSLLRTQKEIHKKGLLFNDNGNHFSESKIKSEWKRYIEGVGINITQHQLRHTYATMLYKAGVDMKTAMSLLGHNNISMIMKVYAHTDDYMLKKACKTLNEFMCDKYEVVD